MTQNATDADAIKLLTNRYHEKLLCKRPELGEKNHHIPALYKPEYDAWLRSFGLIPRWEIHKDCHEDCIWHGYRPNPSSLVYCFKSALYPSNETLNAWTHFIPLLFVIWKVISVAGDLKEPFEEITYPFWIQSFGTTAVFLASTIAHLFSCYSAIGQELCYCLDYGMIPVFGLTVAISFDHYLCSLDCLGMQTDFPPRIYLIVMSIVAMIATCFSCLSRYPSCPHKNLCRFAPYALCYALGQLPCFIRFFARGADSTDLSYHCKLSKDFNFAYCVTTIAFALAVIMVMSRFPERCYVGKFDVFGHSHQWFHIFTAIGMYIQHSTAEQALKEAIALRDNSLLDERSLQISVWSTFVPVLMFVCFLPFIILHTAFKVGRMIIKERKKKS